MKPPFPAYEGDEPFVFVSYSHADSDRVFEELRFLKDAGINIWYDEGITPGSRWSDELASAIERADLFLALLTTSAVSSENCLNEIDFALRRRRPFLAVELEPVELPPGIELNIGNRQSILKYRFEEADYRTRLLDAINRANAPEAVMRGGGGGHAPPHQPETRRSPRWAIVSVIAVLITAGLFYAAMQFLPETDRPTEFETVAVLPFQNMSADPEFDYLADGLADELITALGSVSEFSVSSRTSSFYFKNRNPQMRDIRERLGVDHAIEGSIRPGPTRLTVNVSLFETDQGKQIWTHQFESSRDAISALSARIAQALAAELRPDADLRKNVLTEPSTSVSATAYEAFLKGLDFLNRPPTPEVLDAALLHLDAALQAQPNFTRAAAARCDAHLAYYRMARTEEGNLHYEQARQWCDEALRLDPTIASGHQSLATLYRVSGRFQEALSEIRLADTLQPDNAFVQYEYGKILAQLNQMLQAEQKFRRGIELDPGYWGGYADLGDFLYLRGRYAETLELFKKVHELTPDNGLVLVSLGATYYMLDEPRLAQAVWKEAVSENPDSESRAFWQAATWLGINSLNSSCPAEAAYWQQQAISVSPNDHRLWGRLAESCQMQQSDPSDPSPSTQQIYQRAIALAKSELAENPNDWETLGLLALYRARSGTEGETAELIDRMLGLQSSNPDALEIAAFFAVETGDKTNRDRFFDRLLKLNYPASLLKRNPYLSTLQSCGLESNAKERLICEQGKIIP